MKTKIDEYPLHVTQFKICLQFGVQNHCRKWWFHCILVYTVE